MRIYTLNYTMINGIIGVIIILLGIIISLNSYVGCSGQSYNFLNHFVSELGQYKCSSKANIFNLSLIVGSPLLILYYLNITPKSSRNIQLLFKFIITAIGCSAISIGIFSMDDIIIHIICALIFFYLCFFASLLFTIYFVFIKKENMPKYFIISAILISITTLLNIIQFHNLEASMLITLKNRPNVLFICIIEWISLIAMLLFFISSIIFFRKKTENTNQYKSNKINNLSSFYLIMLAIN